MVFLSINYLEIMIILVYKMEVGHLVGKVLKVIVNMKSKIKKKANASSILDGLKNLN